MNIEKLSYKDLVCLHAEHHMKSEIPNSTIEHASDILSVMFEKAQKEVKIFSGALNAIVYDDSTFLSQISDFIGEPKKGKLTIFF